MGIVVDLDLEIDGLNVSDLNEVEKLIDDIQSKCDTIYPIKYIIRYME